MRNMSGRRDKAWLDNEIVGSMKTPSKRTSARVRASLRTAGRYDHEHAQKRFARQVGAAAFNAQHRQLNSTADNSDATRLRVRGSNTVAEIAGDIRLAN
jgi:hypothetical protein